MNEQQIVEQILTQLKSVETAKQRIYVMGTIDEQVKRKLEKTFCMVDINRESQMPDYVLIPIEKHNSLEREDSKELEKPLRKRLLLESDIKTMGLKENSQLTVSKHCIVTPLAMDYLMIHGIKIIRE